MTRISRPLLGPRLAIALVATLFSASYVDSVQAQIADVNADQAEGCRDPNQVIGAQDRAEILDLIDRYGPYFDYGEGEAWASLFTEDGELNFPAIGLGSPIIDPTGSRRTSIKGHDRLAAFASGSAGPKTVLAHVPTITMLVSAGPQHARAFTPVLIVTDRNDLQFTATVTGLGVYVSDVVKTAHGWRFQKRTADNYAIMPMPPEFLPCQR